MKALFYGWLFGVPFLLIVGVVRRASSPEFPDPAQTAHFATVTGRYLVAALALNIAVPLIGMAVAWRRGEKAWTERFIRSLWWMAVILLFQWALTSGSGQPARDEDPAPRVTHCIPISGGRQCPGG
ncbi:hypothetical protein ACTI_76440 [Actinoplanes sp. OR16]|uniref:hypothetical protein n=1 Tax=Actinoplanes sp. OR16 TaxID=946334 RepID=UPI000F71D42D|nr:hypothetical protein [Actinoplanes sp. OR16]BBH70959.1 hypothetical protein ACTI_76440 [Actinoplanes sp. OR16]